MRTPPRLALVVFPPLARAVLLLALVATPAAAQEPKRTRPSGDSRLDAPEQGRPFAVRVSSRGTMLAGEQDTGRLGRYDLPAARSDTGIAVGDDPADIVFSRDGTRAWVANLASRSVGVIDVDANAQTSTIDIPAGPLRLAISPDDAHVYVTTDRSALVTIDAATSRTSQLELEGTLNGIALNPRRPLLYVTSTSGRLYEVNRTTGRMTRSVVVGSTPQEVVVSADGSRIYVVRERGALVELSAVTLVQTRVSPAVVGGFGMALSPDDAQLWISQPGSSRLLVVDRATLAVVRSFRGGSPRRIAFDATGATAVVGNEAGWVSVIR